MRRATCPIVLSLALTLAGCQATPPAATGVIATGAAHLKLDLSAWAGRRVLSTPATPRLLVRTEALGLAARETAISLADGEAAISGLDAGRLLLITIEGRNEAGQPVAGAVARLLVTLRAGENRLKATDLDFAAGAIAHEVLLADREHQTRLFARLDPAALKAFAGRIAREYGALHPRLLDARVIALNIRDRSGALPDPSPVFLGAASDVLLDTSGWPVGLEADLSLDDPLSYASVARAGEPARLGPVPPGEWTLTVTPRDPELAVKRLSVSVDEGDRLVKLQTDWGAITPLAPLEGPFAPGFWGAFDTPDGPRLVAGGGHGGRGEGMSSFEGMLRIGPDSTMALESSGGDGTLYPAFAVDDGKLYAFGGMAASEGARFPRAWRYDPVTKAPLEPLPDLPDGVTLGGGAAGAIDHRIYLSAASIKTGANEAQPGRVLAFDTTAGDWLTDPLPAMPHPRDFAATAVAGGTWYLFGGWVDGRTNNNGSIIPDQSPSTFVSGFRPGSGWQERAAMPTQRAGATAVVVDGRIWVIGGVTIRNTPCAAVEVYDPVTDRWSRRAPLGTPRALPMVMRDGARLLVMGGLSGLYVGSNQPVAAVEEIAL